MLDKYLIRSLCYELYKLDWKRSHGITYEMEMDCMKDYYEGLVDGPTDYTFKDYVDEFGYGGEVYSCFDEFLENEYQDVEYILQLLDNSVLISTYNEDIEKYSV